MLLVRHFEFLSLNPQQKIGIGKVAEERKDVFFNLPTGFGKSLLYQALPLVFDLEPGHIVVVVSPLISLMEDQVCHLKELGLKAASISSPEDGERTRVESGEYSLVHGPPEAWLKNERGKNDVDFNPLCSDWSNKKQCQ